MEFKNEEGRKNYEEGVANNTDGYGACGYRYLRKWAEIMEKEIEQGKSLKDIADKASHDADTEGITGFMHGCAVSVLSNCWIHGEELRRWHNKEYNHEGEGVVNPAILTISKK